MDNSDHLVVRITANTSLLLLYSTVYTSNGQLYKLYFFLLLCSGFYRQHVSKCEKTAGQSQPQTIELKVNTTEEQQGADDDEGEEADAEPLSCHLCQRPYKNATMLKAHYARTHFYAALREQYLGFMVDSAETAGDNGAEPTFPTCMFCPFR